MPTYVVLGKWTEQGIRNVKDTMTRTEQVRDGRPYTVKAYADGHGKEFAQYWLIPDMGHAWSGGCLCAQYSYPSGPNESKAMYDFFLNHPMP